MKDKSDPTGSPSPSITFTPLLILRTEKKSNVTVVRQAASFIVHSSAKDTKIESSYLNEIPLQMSPKGMWGPENMKIKNFQWGLFEFYISLH